MPDSPWSTPALIARIDVAMTLDGFRQPVSKERAQLRLELLRITESVDSGAMTSVEATIRLEELLVDARASA
jgi:hypothetical protein